MLLILSTCFPSGSLKFSWVLCGVCLCDQPPVKSLGSESRMSFAGREHFRHAVRTHFCGNEALLDLHRWEETLGSFGLSACNFFCTSSRKLTFKIYTIFIVSFSQSPVILLLRRLKNWISSFFRLHGSYGLCHKY